MRRSLSTLFCLASLTAVSACDDATVSGPTTDDQQSLFDFDFRAAPAPSIENYPGNGDITVHNTSSASDDDPGGDTIEFIIIATQVHSRSGTQVATLDANSITSTSGTRCLKTTEGAFTELRDADGTVLYSTAGPWVFAGAPNVEGLDDEARYQVLNDALIMSFEDEAIVAGFPSSGDVLASATEELHYADPMRKLAVTAMVDGACGGEAL